MGKILEGIVIGIILVPVGVLVWLHFGKVPVAVGDAPFPMENRLVHDPLHARIEHEMIKTPPLQPDEATLVAGAKIYSQQCASCHGLHNKPSSFGPIRRAKPTGRLPTAFGSPACRPTSRSCPTLKCGR